METLKVHYSFSQKSAWWKSVGFAVNFVKYMRIVNTLCISKENKVYVIMLISLLKFSMEISKLPWMEEC